MNKKRYICPDTLVSDMDTQASLLTTSPGDIKVDNTNTIDSEADVFSREEGTPWDSEW
ncbi:MAG: hypothetical protein K2F69_04085 [Bacteroidaceae bacterium]|nr:hypothetical protein [Bacteroidaceae bacterium]